MGVRIATVNDLPWLRVLFAQSLKEIGPFTYPTMDDAELDEFVRSVYIHLTQNPDFRVFVAEEDGKIVGFLGGQLDGRSVGRPHVIARPHWLYIEPSARKKGVATALMQAGLVWLRERGITHVECFGMAGDDGWARRGFTPFMVLYQVSVADAEAISQRAHVNGSKPAEAPPKRKRGRPRRQPQMEA